MRGSGILVAMAARQHLEQSLHLVVAVAEVTIDLQEILVVQVAAVLVTDQVLLEPKIPRVFLDGLVMEITVALELLLLEAVVAVAPEVLAE
jgi:hypothetical protein